MLYLVDSNPTNSLKLFWNRFFQNQNFTCIRVFDKYMKKDDTHLFYM